MSIGLFNPGYRLQKGRPFISGGSPPVTPIAPDDSVTGTLVVWLETTKANMYQDNPPTVPVVSTGDTVATWLDQSGNGNDAVPGTTPTYIEINGVPSISCVTGSTKHLSCGNVASFDKTDAFSVAGIVKFSSFAHDMACAGKHDGSIGWNIGGCLYTGDKISVIFQNAGTFREIKGGTTLSTGVPYVYLFTNDGSGTEAGMRLWLNGVEETPTQGGTGMPGTIANSGTLKTGSGLADAGVEFLGDTTSFIVWDGDVSSEAEGLSQYLLNLL